MEAVVNDMDLTGDETAMETLFSYLDKGIDDMEAGRLRTVDDAFQIISDWLSIFMLIYVIQMPQKSYIRI